MQRTLDILREWQIPLAILFGYYLVAAAVIWFVHRKWCSKRRAANPRRYRWFFALVLALVFTPSVISDFFLFMIPGPAFLGFLVLVPGMLVQLFSDLRVFVAILVTTFVYHLLPLLLSFSVAYAVLRHRDRHRSPHVTQSV